MHEVVVEEDAKHDVGDDVGADERGDSDDLRVRADSIERPATHHDREPEGCGNDDDDVVRRDRTGGAMPSPTVMKTSGLMAVATRVEHENDALDRLPQATRECRVGTPQHYSNDLHRNEAEHDEGNPSGKAYQSQRARRSRGRSPSRWRWKAVQVRVESLSPPHTKATTITKNTKIRKYPVVRRRT